MSTKGFRCRYTNLVSTTEVITTHGIRHSFAVQANTAQQRSWTCVLYLNDVESGGGTYFPLVDKRVMPKKGQVSCWNNLGADGKTNDWTKHMGEDVTGGKKYLANFWYNTTHTCPNETAFSALASPTQSGGKRVFVAISLLLLIALVVFLMYK